MSTAGRGTAVITGTGVVAPTGVGADQYWKATVDGRVGIGEIRRFDPARYPVRLAGQVDDLDPAAVLDPRVVPQTDLFTQFALVATELAFASAGLSPADLDPFDIGVVTATSSGGNAFGQREIQALWAHGPAHVGPYQSIAWFYAASTGQISIANRLKGPCAVVATESAGGLDVLAHAAGEIARGVPVMLCGGTEAPVSPYALTCQLPSGLLSHATDPEAAYRPFMSDADGYVPAEGGAMLLVEDAVHAAERGAPVLARFAGHAATFAGRVPSRASDRLSWEDTATALAVAIRAALRRAGRSPADVDVVFADATGTPAADRAEVRALAEVLGPRAAGVPVTAPKAGTGRLYSGAAALDVATAALALRDGVVPPTPAASAEDLAHDIDLVVGSARRMPLRTALVLARGFGGFATALVLAAPTDAGT